MVGSSVWTLRTRSRSWPVVWPLHHRSHWPPVHSAGHRSEVPHQGSTVRHTPEQAGGREQLIFKVNLRIGFKVIVLPFFFSFFFCLQKHTFSPIVCGNAGQPKLFKMTKKGAKIVVDQKGHQRSSFFCTSLQRGYSISESMT